GLGPENACRQALLVVHVRDLQPDQVGTAGDDQRGGGRVPLPEDTQDALLRDQSIQSARTARAGEGKVSHQLPTALGERDQRGRRRLCGDAGQLVASPGVGHGLEPLESGSLAEAANSFDVFHGWSLLRPGAAPSTAANRFYQRGGRQSQSEGESGPGMAPGGLEPARTILYYCRVRCRTAWKGVVSGYTGAPGHGGRGPDRCRGVRGRRDHAIGHELTLGGPPRARP